MAGCRGVAATGLGFLGGKASGVDKSERRESLAADGGGRGKRRGGGV